MSSRHPGCESRRPEASDELAALGTVPLVTERAYRFPEPLPTLATRPLFQGHRIAPYKQKLNYSFCSKFEHYAINHSRNEVYWYKPSQKCRLQRTCFPDFLLLYFKYFVVCLVDKY